MRFPALVIMVTILLSPGWLVVYAEEQGEVSIKVALQQFSQGNYLQAAEQFRQAADAAQLSGNTQQQILASTYLADVLRAQGQPGRSIEILESVRPLAEVQDDPLAIAQLYGRLGTAYTRVGSFDRADTLLQQAAELAGTAGDDGILAALQNDQGNLLVLNGKLNAAKNAFQKSIAAAGRSNRLQVEVSARNNLVRTLLVQNQRKQVVDLLASNYKQAITLPDSVAKAQSLITIGTFLQQTQAWSLSRDELRTRAFTVLQEGLALARQLHDRRLESYALGYIGGLYEIEGRLEEAQSYTNRAAFIAQSIGAHDSLYLWEWQSARLLRDSGETDKALLAYKQSINSLQKIRAGLAYSTYGGFKEKVGPVFLEYADLLLTQAPQITDTKAAQALLGEVRLTLEQSKVAEVEDYFQDECAVTEENLAYLDTLSPGIAVIYPVLLPDRTEILVSLPDGIHQYTAPVGEQALTAEVRQFRAGLESAQPQHQYRSHAHTLYRWLVEPLEKELERQQVNTLVFVPDGSLRSVPLSALHDGRGFLIERYAVATTPGLTLTNPQPIAREGINVLASGITESVQGFPALPNVASELDSIQSYFPDNMTLKDKSFVLKNVRDEMAEGNYSIVHLATHGQFDSDHRKSFLLAYDEKFTMQRLSETIRARRYQGESIELLVLSACQTAAGDDRAALGLAGVAIQAGARSALASLWFISDEATADLIGEFYKQLKTSDHSKAEALRQAQLSLLQQEQYRHPAYWAPFLLVGNWL